MVLDTNIKKKNKAAHNKAAHNKSSRAGGLTLRILSVNVLPLLVLVVGLLSLGQYQENLIREQLKTLKEQAKNFAIALEGPEESFALVPEQEKRIIKKLSEKRHDTRIRLFDVQGTLIADSRKLLKERGKTQMPARKTSKNEFGISDVIAYLGTNLLKLLPTKNILPPFPYDIESAPSDMTSRINEFSDIKKALHGLITVAAWKGGVNHVILTAAAPLTKNGQVIGVVLLSNNGRNIENGMDRVRFDVLTATLAALSITIFLSIYLAGIIGRPLKKLAVAAEEVRHSKGREVNIPDLSHRRDEIGELSMALRHMTQALWDRMDSIERFAADVSHEIKNPLTSLRSAVETVAKVKNKKDRDRLMAIIQHDVRRLDRLISDISNASRLDAALSRDELKAVDLHKILQQLVDAHKQPLKRGSKNNKGGGAVNLEIPENKEIPVRGNEGRLAQVFGNLISNALSFSPENGIVTVRVLPDDKHMTIEVRDKGPGLPENKLDDIFKRFYSERPKGEEFGSHSGLGLSIARQIIIAHGGEIFAENIMQGDEIQGACFTVILDREI